MEGEYVLSEEEMNNGKTKTIKDAVFPFLDMAMARDNSKQLNFGVYRKPKQALKYVDTSSTHRPTAFKSITSGLPGTCKSPTGCWCYPEGIPNYR
eukprot:88586-Ditylum_brightwellii.AAC.1